jgi:hypothetical protein
MKIKLKGKQSAILDRLLVLEVEAELDKEFPGVNQNDESLIVFMNRCNVRLPLKKRLVSITFFFGVILSCILPSKRFFAYMLRMQENRRKDKYERKHNGLKGYQPIPVDEIIERLERYSRFFP